MVNDHPLKDFIMEEASPADLLPGGATL